MVEEHPKTPNLEDLNPQNPEVPPVSARSLWSSASAACQWPSLAQATSTWDPKMSEAWGFCDSKNAGEACSGAKALHDRNPKQPGKSFKSFGGFGGLRLVWLVTPSDDFGATQAN